MTPEALVATETFLRFLQCLGVVFDDSDWNQIEADIMEKMGLPQSFSFDPFPRLRAESREMTRRVADRRIRLAS